MEKLVGQIKWVETDDGYRIEINGAKLKEMLSSCGCPPMMMSCCCGSRKEDDCCKPKKES